MTAAVMERERFEADQDAALCEQLVSDFGAIRGRVLPDGSIALIGDLLFTRAIYLGVSRTGWANRFCFEDRRLAMLRFDELGSETDEPLGYVARR
ncbi:MAG: hypothetical protein E6R08_00480 [Nevskiaceae bacterium]|nr:MAG: hypothetical protein E6R08_00480 [Nevskiaceae bacterium]